MVQKSTRDNGFIVTAGIGAAVATGPAGRQPCEPARQARAGGIEMMIDRSIWKRSWLAYALVTVQAILFVLVLYVFWYRPFAN
jgi:hypothetical protein